jgi:hypothetical protein
MIDQDTIFLLGAEGRLKRMPHRQYDTEDLLQGLIDQYPELLVGEQIDRDQPPRWLMVSREAGIPAVDGGADRWSIDHVLLDQRGLPTLVEVKRSSDTRIRREVVGQMLDYAANARKYWPQERLRELAASHCGGLDALEEHLRTLLDDSEADIEVFWETVDRNLREGELRLLFVADEIPTELRRIIEFLNEQMPRIEVLGIEIRQYEREGTRVLVPRVVGQTESARQAKRSAGGKSKVTPEQFLDACSDRSREFFQRLFEEAQRRGFTIYWGTARFSLRAPDPSGSLTTLGYGVPPHYYGTEQGDAQFEVFLGALKDQTAADSLRARMLRDEFIVQHSPNTLFVQLEQAKPNHPREILRPLLEFGESLSQAKTPRP